MELSPGTSICGRFELVREESPNTGVPVFGPTWVVIDGQRGEPARACVLDASLLPTAEARAAFVRVQRELSELRDAALVPQVFVGEDGDVVVVCYEPLADAFPLGDLYEGPGAADLLQDCGRIARQLARALASLHARGQVHGMLACEAVFVAPGGPATFQHGFAPLCARAELERRCRAFHIAGVAPEVLAGGPFTPASDVYGWAAAMLQLVTGQRGEAALRAPEPAGLPTGLWSVLRACLSEQPSARPQAGDELVTRLEALAVAPVSTPPAAEPEPPVPQASSPAAPPPVPKVSPPEPVEPVRPRPPTVPLPVTSIEELLLASDHPRPTPPPEVVATPSASTTGAHPTLDGEARVAGRSATGLRRVHVLTEDAIVRPGKPPRAPGEPPGEPSDVIIGGTKAELEEASRATTVRLDPDNAGEAIKAAREAARRSALIAVPREEAATASATVAPAAVSTIAGEPASAASGSNAGPAGPAGQSTVAAAAGKKSDTSFWLLVVALLVVLAVAWSFG
jgi:hypothetical protein